MEMKKKVIALVVDTDLTNEDIESNDVEVVVIRRNEGAETETFRLPARNIRVLDSD